MKTLINNIKTFLESAITAGRVSATVVVKGLWEEPEQVPMNVYPFISIDDGGERVEDNSSNKSQTRYYTVVLVLGAYNTDRANSIDAIIDLTDEVKKEFETLANRQKDGHIWGVSIIPWYWEDQRGYFRGRVITIDYFELEDRIFEY